MCGGLLAPAQPGPQASALPGATSPTPQEWSFFEPVGLGWP